MQRVFDLMFSGIALLILLPIFIPVIIILRFTGEGEIFFIQPRIGISGKSFGLIKFVTMIKGSQNIGTGELTIKNDPRVLPFGHFLRKTKINELSQLLNIFKGDMSFVGPRPMVKSTFKKYGPLGKVIYQERPGLTGIGSIVFRDEEGFLENQKDPINFYFEEIVPYKVKLELWYIKNKSNFLYFILIFLTAWSVLRPNSIIYKRIFRDLPSLPQSLTSK